ncbi:hypothetical protein CDAR_376401 [Caerostris darwini]|uniref:Uncharacterized protein n=1 Tax=Caerostris darwini TaxID=1538125 RepID=A0AAV4UYZ8_9ARAC|nr:hypothetical protein CDAR_376401 [Caerostris darwini]
MQKRFFFDHHGTFYFQAIGPIFNGGMITTVGPNSSGNSSQMRVDSVLDLIVDENCLINSKSHPCGDRVRKNCPFVVLACRRRRLNRTWPCWLGVGRRVYNPAP